MNSLNNDLTFYRVMDELKTEVLEMLLEGASQREIFSKLCSRLEQNDESVYCSIVLFENNEGQMRFIAGPRIPQLLVELISNTPVKENYISCSHAMATKSVFVLSSMYESENWLGNYDVLDSCGFHSSWSVPFFDQDDVAIGCFTIYKKQKTTPNEIELKNMKAFTSLVALVLKHSAIKKENEAYQKYLKETVNEDHIVIDNLSTDLFKRLKEIRHIQNQLISERKRTSLTGICTALAHEINNPLNLLQGSLTLLRDSIDKSNCDDSEPLSKEELQETIRIMDASLSRLSGLVKNVQQLTPKPNNENVDDVGCIEQKLSGVLKEIRRNNSFGDVSFVVDGSLGVGTLNTNVVNIVLSNLLKNSFESVEQKIKSGEDFVPKVEIVSYKLNKSIYFKVFDNGLGINRDHIDDIFIPFISSKMGTRCSGFGATIAKSYIDYMGGHISVESEIGKYTQVNFDIPLK